MNLDIGPRFVPGSILSSVLESVELNDFMAKHWQREPLLLDGRVPGHFDEIFSLDSLDRLLEHTAIPEGNIDMGIDAVGADPGSYKPHGVADAAMAFKMHATGKTMILRAMHNYDAGLRQCCAALSSVFRCNTQANVYVTPAGTKSSYPHWDAHDLFILQVAGSKVWTLHETGMDLPHPDFRFDPETHPIGKPIGEIEVGPGDTLYLPRGAAHNPYATSHSVHVSLGVQVVTWYDVLTAALERRCGDTTSVREALPLLSDGLGLAHEVMADQLAEVLGEALATEAVAGVAEHLLDAAARHQLATDTSGMLARAVDGLVGLNSGTVVELRTRLPSRSSAEVAGSTRVLLSGLEFAVHPTQAEMADYVIERQRVRAAELPGDDLEAKLAFLNLLLEEGCVQVVGS